LFWLSPVFPAINGWAIFEDAHFLVDHGIDGKILFRGEQKELGV
jgi:hypothetical protein